METFGANGNRPYVSVNLSAQQFHEPRLVGVIEEVLASYGVSPERLVIEITEGVMLRDATEATNVISRLQELGVGFALDDFGTGYSSLSYLASMHPRVIKIVQSFVRPTQEGARNDALLETIVSLGQALHHNARRGYRDAGATRTASRSGLRTGSGLPLFSGGAE